MNATQALVPVVRQINHVLAQLAPADYYRPLPEFAGSSLGQHFRHILEFFQCLERGTDAGMVDYASRERNLLYETDPALTAEAFGMFADALENFDCQQVVSVRAEFGTESRPVYDSTVGRELMFVYDHAIHHLAMIKVGLRCQFPAVNADADLGVSPSTLKFRQAAAS